MSTPTVYHIRVQGQLDEVWAEWFDGLTVTHETNGDTTLTGLVRDQAALHGLLVKIRNLGLPLIAVNPEAPLDRLSPDGTPACRAEPPR